MKTALTSYSLASTDALVSALVPTTGVWDDSLGGICCVADTGSTNVGTLALIKPDGKYVQYGRRSVTYTHIGYSHDGYIATRTSGLIGQRTDPRATLPIGTARTANATGSFAMLSDRFLYFDGKNVTYATFGGSTGTAAVINAAGGSAGSIFPYNLAGGNNLWWLCDHTNGYLYLYNATAVAKVADYDSGFGGAVVFATYSRKHNVFGVVMNSLPTTLKLFANVPQAASISTPTMSASVIVGIRNTCSVTVLGSNSEPCPNRAVTFSSDAGAFPVPTVLTNASGVASATFEPPWSWVETITITATLTE